MSLDTFGRYINKTNLYHISHFIRYYGVRNSIRKVKSYLTENRAYASWLSSHRLTPSETAAQRLEEKTFSFRPKISILVPTYKTDPEFLRQMITSVISQTYTNWELCIVDGSPDHSQIQSIVKDFQQSLIYTAEKEQDHSAEKIHFLALEENLGISGNTNSALSLASGDYIALLDHDDLLEENALFEIVKALNGPTQPKEQGASPDLCSSENQSGKFSPMADIIYTDEDMLRSGDDAFFHNPAFKPDFNSDYLNSCNYITHFFVVKRQIALLAGGFSSDCDGSQDYDFILKTTDQADVIVHVPQVLYHWRVHMNSVAGNPEDKMYAYDSAVRALNRHYQRLGIPARAFKDVQLGFYRTVYAVRGLPMVSIVCKNGSSDLRSELEKQITYPNYEIVSHASEACGEYLLFLNGIDQVSMATPSASFMSDAPAYNPIPSSTGFLSLMLANCQREDIGLVGVKVLDHSLHVAECGLYYTINRSVYSPFRGLLQNEPGYYGIAENQHFVSLIGPACFMVSRKVLQAHRPKSGESADIYHLCMNLQKSSLHITVIPQIHAVLKSDVQTGSLSNRIPVYRFKDNPAFMQVHPHDPFYTPNFSQERPYEL